MMTAQQYVTRKAGIAGGIRALVKAQAPCETGCKAHDSIVAVHTLQADNIETDAEFFGNGFGDAVADRVAEKLKESPVVQTQKAMPVPTPWGVKHVSEALLWRVAIILTVLFASKFLNRSITEQDLARAVRVAIGVPAATNATARVP